MTKILQRDLIEAGLITAGAKLEPIQNSRKYRVFVHKGDRYFVGTAGSLRFGRNYTESRALAETSKQRVMNAGAKLLEKTS